MGRGQRPPNINIVVVTHGQREMETPSLRQLILRLGLAFMEGWSDESDPTEVQSKCIPKTV